MATVFTPYTTGAPLFGQKPSWIQDELDQARIQSYQLYEEIYWNVPNIFAVTVRGSNDQPIYVPSGRTIVDATNRYTAPKFSVTLDNATGEGPDTPDLIAARLAVDDLIRRERFRSKFSGNKRYGLIRGDWIWHVTADPSKAQGRRISIVALDPAMYFPIPDPEDVDVITGCHLVEQIVTPDGPRIRRQTYRKVPRVDGLNTITVEDAIFKVDSWSGPDAKPEKQLRQPTPLPDTITALPVYHIRNFDEPGNPFGSSELRGLEVLMGALNQTVSDEDLTLALDGIGVYATDAPQPVDPITGLPVPWRLGPGRVAHHPVGNTFERISGVGSVSPYGEHYDRLWSALEAASSTPKIAIGNVDVSVANSGIALALQLGPMLAKADEKNELILDVHNQMWFDLINGWFPGFEETTFNDVRPTCGVGSAVPVDREKRFVELNDMLDRHVIDTAYYRSEAAKLGYTFPDDIATTITSEQDAFAARATGELNNGGQ
jgi:hypothetical protein